MVSDILIRALRLCACSPMSFSTRRQCVERSRNHARVSAKLPLCAALSRTVLDIKRHAVGSAALWIAYVKKRRPKKVQCLSNP